MAVRMNQPIPTGIGEFPELNDVEWFLLELYVEASTERNSGFDFGYIPISAINHVVSVYLTDECYFARKVLLKVDAAMVADAREKNGNS